jgi:hypothetical protein
MDAWIVALMQNEVRSVLGSKTEDRSTVERFLLNTVPFSGTGSKQARDKRRQLLVKNSPVMLAQLIGDIGTVDYSLAAALILTDLLRTTMTQGYDSWFDHHARRCGFLAPRRGPSAKRLCIEASLVTTLVLAGLDDGERRIPYTLWLDRLSERFGIVAAPSPIARSMPMPAVETDLEENRDSLASLIGRVGLARSYSDNTVEVLSPLPE